MNSLSPVVETCKASDSGYANRQYAQSLAEFGTVQELPRSRGWLLVNRIPDSDSCDAMGCYPLFCCQDWTALRADLDALAESLVCVRLVTDPFADVDVSQLKEAFPDVCYEYKQHFVTDLSLPLEQTVASHHRRNVSKATSAVEVRQSTSEEDLLSQWQTLYDNLVDRHQIAGIARFSPLAFERQSKVPGFAAFSAYDGDSVCGTTLWFVRGDVAYYHLGAYSDRGYDCGASFALFWNALRHFAGQGIRWAALGAGAGATSAESGLTRFKRGWATHTRPVFFCGRILQPAAYEKLTADIRSRTDFFPAYRSA